MPMDIYKIKLVHLINPYFIWVEVDSADGKRTLEQIGLYGLLPHERTIDLLTNEFVDVSCREWVPATSTLIQEFLEDAKETWFRPTYIDRRGSILQDNIHKYGDVAIRTTDGELKKLSDWLITTGFGQHNESDFYQQLIEGKMLLKDFELRKMYSIIDSYYSSYKEYDMFHNIRSSIKDCHNLTSAQSTFTELSQVCSINSNVKSAEEYEELSMGRACSRYKIYDTPKPPLKLSSPKSSGGSDASYNSGNNANNLKMVTEMLPEQLVNKQEKEVSKEWKEIQHKETNTGNTQLQRRLQMFKSLPNKATAINKEKNEDKKSGLETKYQLYKKISKKGSPHLKAANEGTLSDDEIADVIENINTAYPKNNNKNTKLVKEINDDLFNIELDTGVGNIGSYMCHFVEKLVTPVLMVHSKFSKVIKPVYTMRDIPFNQHIHTVLKNMSVTVPMDLQSISWYTILRGHSIFMVSPKNSGKTMGYLPCVCRLVSDGTPDKDSIGPICIIVCATVESVSVVERIAKMLLGLHEKVVACYAGVDEVFITTSLLNRCDLLICTPSALVRILQDRDFGVDLQRLSTFVLDDCERLDQIYKQELKYFHYKIKEVEKSRANKELKVQYVVASRVWCDFMESLAKKAPDTVVSIGSFSECVLYSKAHMSVSFVVKDNKVNSVTVFLNDTDSSKKVVVICRYNEDVEILVRELKYLKRYIFVGHNNLTVNELYNLSAAWRDYNVPMFGPILICTDDNLSHLNLTDANYLIHYSLPNSFSLFRKRFSVLNDNYPSIFSSESKSIKIKILLEDVDAEKLPKILNFIKRCTDNVPFCLEELSHKVMAKRDMSKAKKLVPMCEALLSLGYCPDFYDCLSRHTVSNEFDIPGTWIPKTGTVTFKILHYHTATSYSARLLSHIKKHEEVKFPQTYNTLSLKLGMYFGKESNRQLHGTPKISDICAVSVKCNLFARCQVVTILSSYQNSNPNYVLVKLLDEEKYERTRDIYLYHLPKEFRELNTYVVRIVLVNVQPKDKDITFSTLAREHIQNLVNAEEDIYLRSHIIGIIGSCIFVDTFEACQELSTLDEVVVKHNLIGELLDKHAEKNPDHLTKLQGLCIQNNFRMTVEQELDELKISKKKANVNWAHLNQGETTGVYVSAITNPDECFVRLSKFESCMNLLLMDIKKHIETNLKPLQNIEIGDIVLAKFPEDDTYERARVDSIENDTIKCFFVDQGDWGMVSSKHVFTITDKLISQLPFQSIECRLIGIKPPGNSWTDFCINWFSNYADEGTKLLYAQYFIKESAKITGGNKYAIALIDTNTNCDIIVNQLMIDLNLALEVEDELTYLHGITDACPKENSEVAIEEDEDEWTKLPTSLQNCAINENSQKASLSKIFPPEPKRTVPLIDSDCESDTSDKWEVYNPKDFLSTFLPQINAMTETKPELPAIANNLKIDEVVNLKSIVKSEDLDSGDTHIKDQKRKPKLTWRQNKSTVQVKIQLIGVEKYELTIEDRALKFSTFIHDTNYSFDFNLYAVVDVTLCSHSNKGQYILVKLTKVLKKNWLTLTKDPEIKKWILYDVDGLEPSSDEESVDDSVLKIVKEIHYKQDSDSDIDDCIDDITHK